MSKKKEQILPLTRWQYFFKALYHDAAGTTEFTYNRVVYRKSEELQAIEQRSAKINYLLLVLMMAMIVFATRLHNIYLFLAYIVLLIAGQIVRYCMLPKDITAHLTDTGRRAKVR